MNKEIEKQYIPLGSIERVITPILKNTSYRKSKTALVALRKFAESSTIEVVEAVSHLTKLSKRKTMTEDDVKTYFQLINYSTELIIPVIPYANIVRLANKVLDSEFRKTREAMSLIRYIIESKLRTLIKKVIHNMDSLLVSKKTITDIEIVIALE